MTKAVVSWLEKSGQPAVEQDNIGQIARIIYESIALKCRYGLEAVKRAAVSGVDIIYVVGGTSGVDFLNKMLACALNLPVITGASEAAAVGNVLMQAVGRGELAGEGEVREIAENSSPLKRFEPEEAGKWDARYKEFLQICGLEEVAPR